jgi:hypothetical protein
MAPLEPDRPKTRHKEFTMEPPPRAIATSLQKFAANRDFIFVTKQAKKFE